MTTTTQQLGESALPEKLNALRLLLGPFLNPKRAIRSTSSYSTRWLGSLIGSRHLSLIPKAPILTHLPNNGTV